MRGFSKLKKVVSKLQTVPKFKADFETDDDFWKKLDEILNVLVHPYEITLKMQKVGYGLSDFYFSWQLMKMRLQKLVSQSELNVAENILKNIAEREKSLLETPTMLLACYLDPKLKGVFFLVLLFISFNNKEKKILDI